MPDALAPKLALARAVGALSRLRGGGATSLPGKVLVRIEPGAIGALGARLARGSVLVSATNGKTTTTAMAARILEHAGIPLVHNHAGANMAGGVAAALLAAARPRGTIAGELGLFEVDELWLDAVADQLHPRAILLGNLFRDQLDRYGELETIAERWAHDLHARRLVLNADDPLIADLGREAPDALYYGVEDDSLALPGMAHAADAKHCRRCGAPYAFESIYLGHLGHYHCPSCGRRRPTPTVTASRVALHGVRAAHFTLRTPAGESEVALALPGLYNVYNALAAVALATALEVELDHIVAGLQDAKAAFGRAETISLSVPHADGGAGVAEAPRDLRILLVKNPAGANEVLRTLALEPGEHDLLGVLNDNIADGRDVSWIWDADFELLTGRVRRFTCSGTRAPELAVRAKYAGIDPARIRVQPDLAVALREAAGDRPDPDAPLYALPTYTAMLSLREILIGRGGEQRLVVSAAHEAARPRDRGAATPREVVWHDLECGSYRVDLTVWRELAERHPGPLLDVGAGTGRVALDLARAGHDVTAVDVDPLLLDAVRARAGRARIEVVCADARSLRLDRRDFSLCVAPMQTIQLLGGSAQREAFLRAVRAHLRPGGLLACAVLSSLEPFDCADGEIGPSPERTCVDGLLYVSRPTRVALRRRTVVIERERRIFAPRPAGATVATGDQDGGLELSCERDLIELDRVSAAELEREGIAAGLRPEPAREVPSTADYVGSAVVMLRA